MTIDERLAKLAERVDGIARSVELLTTLHRDLEEQAARHREETRAAFAQTAAHFADTLQFINRLAHIAEAH